MDPFSGSMPTRLFSLVYKDAYWFSPFSMYSGIFAGSMSRPRTDSVASAMVLVITSRRLPDMALPLRLPEMDWRVISLIMSPAPAVAGFENLLVSFSLLLVVGMGLQAMSGQDRTKPRPQTLFGHDLIRNLVAVHRDVDGGIILKARVSGIWSVAAGENAGYVVYAAFTPAVP